MTVAAPAKQQGVGKAAKKNVFATLFAFVVWQVIAILFVEYILFMAGLGEEEMFKLDPELGSKHMTNKRITWRSEGYAVSFLDVDGMREPGLTIAKPANTYRVALLGDSMVEGFQVPIEKTYGQLLEKNLKAGGRKVQVLNFGTSGYSTAQEYLQLKKQVMQYQPDLVVLGYNSRDIFENWSPPDQTITNVRPVALHLPGRKLIIDSSSVQHWMRSKRAKFLMQIDWIRHNSRIWGFWSAMQTELSFHNAAYRIFCMFFDKPAKAWEELKKEVANALKPSQQQPAFAIAKFESIASDKKAAAPNAEPVKEELISAAPNKVLEKGATAATAAANKAEAKPVDGRKNYIDLITRTEKSLFDEMRKTCEAGGAKFAVVLMPVRSALCPAPGMETSFLFIDYPQEIAMISNVCKDLSIPTFNVQAIAKQFSTDDQARLFYSVHFTPRGHEFMAESLRSFLNDQIK